MEPPDILYTIVGRDEKVFVVLGQGWPPTPHGFLTMHKTGEGDQWRFQHRVFCPWLSEM